MDTLVDAAAVVTIACDANAPEDSGQRGSSVTVGLDDAAMADVHTTSDNKEDNDVHAAAGETEDALSKVTIDPAVLCPAQ